MKNKYLSLGLLAFGMFFAQNSFAQTDAEKQKIAQSYNQQKLSVMETSFQSKAQAEKEEAHRIAAQKGWKLKIQMQDGRLLELQKVVEGKPVYYTTFNVNAARSTRTNHLNSGGSLGLNLMGQNMTAYVWDGGVARASHQEYDGAGGTNRFSTGDSGSLNYHSAHVTGTIMASGVVSSAKGMAPYARAVGYDWNSDKTEATSAASNGMLVSNHSYGYAARNPNTGQVQLPQYYFGGYIGESRAWDEIMFNAPNYLMVVAAGNDGNDNTANTNPTGGSGFDKLTGHSTAKNNLVVANAQDANIDSNGNLVSVSINSSSSEGPTDDFRIKPDITGNGSGVYSTYHNSDTSYNSLTGTSMASPNVAGSVLLLQQHYNNVNNSFARAATIKGIVLHTADDAGAAGPDAVFGWGLMNAKRAAETISNNGNESRIEQLTLTSGQSYTITVNSDGVNPLLASISWTDRAGTATTTVNSTTPVLVNDLDIRVTKSGTTYFPYELTGATTSARRDNNVDPYERVDVSGASGTYTITVTHKGSLVGGSQNFSLIVTGLSATATCNATTPTGVSTSGVTTSGATVSWNAVAGATYDVRYRATGTSSWTTTAVSGTSKTLSGLSSSTSYEVQVRSKCSSGNSSYSTSVNFTTAGSGGGSPSCSTTITSFPYSEGFENTLGAWTQSTADDINWTVDASGTPSNNTGPSSASQGTYYVYVEASGSGTGYPNKRAILNSPCFDLSGATQATFEFKYHMYGASDMGRISLEASNNGTTWTSLWTETGNKGNSWQSASVDLSAYAGGTVQLRFNRITGATWQADVAIDDVSLSTSGGGSGPSCSNVSLSITFDNYPEETSWEITNSGGQVVASGGTYASQPDGSTLTIDVGCLADGCYSFKMKDSYGDGMCCSYGNGSYTLKNNDTGANLATGGSFTSSDTKNFCLSASSTTSTNNYITTYDDTLTASSFDVKIYPNPVKGGLLHVTTGQDNATYAITNMVGQQVAKGNVTSGAINVSKLRAGIYMIQVNAGSQSVTKKFIKQ